MVCDRVWKWLRRDRISPFHGELQWPDLGEWYEYTGELRADYRGLHLCRSQDLPFWCAEELYEAEFQGESLEGTNALVGTKARLVRRVETWTDRTARLFACECVENVLPIWDQWLPHERCLPRALKVARQFAEGCGATEDDREGAFQLAKFCLEYAERTVQYHPTWVAVLDVAWGVLECLRVYSDSEMARSAASFARSAAGRAGLDVARMEREWQSRRLMEMLYPQGA